MDELGKFEDDPGYVYLEVSREERAALAAKPFDSKKNCWIPDTEDGMASWQLMIIENMSMRTFEYFRSSCSCTTAQLRMD